MSGKPKRDIVIRVRLSRAEYDFLFSHCQRAHMTVSEAVRLATMHVVHKARYAEPIIGEKLRS
jgi:hypothetical protein